MRTIAPSALATLRHLPGASVLCGWRCRVRTGRGVVSALDNPASSGWAEFGWSVAGISDLNGDRVSELVVGAPGFGKAYVFSGADGSLLRTLIQPERRPSTGFGATVTDVGDINGDGLADLLVGDPPSYPGRAGQVHL